MTIDPIWTKAVLEAVYDSRSDIVHSGKSLVDIKIPKKLSTSTKLRTVHQLVDACELITRSVLCEYLKELKTGKSMMEIIKHLDQLIIDGITAGTQFDEMKDNPTRIYDSD